jgi:hypothetical protein
MDETQTPTAAAAADVRRKESTGSDRSDKKLL